MHISVNYDQVYACADSVARTPIGVNGIFFSKLVNDILDCTLFCSELCTLYWPSVDMLLTLLTLKMVSSIAFFKDFHLRRRGCTQ